MISKAFQDIVSQMAEVFPKKFGITDATGLVLAASGPEISEDLIEELIGVSDEAGKIFVREGYTVRLIDGRPYSEIVEIARAYIKEIGGFEKFAEWGLVR